MKELLIWLSILSLYKYTAYHNPCTQQQKLQYTPGWEMTSNTWGVIPSVMAWIFIMVSVNYTLHTLNGSCAGLHSTHGSSSSHYPVPIKITRNKSFLRLLRILCSYKIFMHKIQEICVDVTEDLIIARGRNQAHICMLSTTGNGGIPNQDWAHSPPCLKYVCLVKYIILFIS